MSVYKTLMPTPLTTNGYTISRLSCCSLYQVPNFHLLGMLVASTVPPIIE